MLTLSKSELALNARLLQLGMYAPLLKTFLARSSSLGALGERVPYWGSELALSDRARVAFQDEPSLSKKHFFNESMFD